MTTMNTTVTHVGHIQPDLDCTLALWLAQTFLVAPGERIQRGFVPHEAGGESHPPQYMVVDTGGGQFDHHGPTKDHGATCAATLVAQYIESHGARSTPWCELAQVQPLVDFVHAHDTTGKGVERLLTQCGADSDHPAAQAVLRWNLVAVQQGIHLLARNHHRSWWQRLRGHEATADHWIYSQLTTLFDSIVATQQVAPHPAAQQMPRSFIQYQLNLPPETDALLTFGVRAAIAEAGGDPDHPAAQILGAIGPSAWGVGPAAQTAWRALAAAEEQRQVVAATVAQIAHYTIYDQDGVLAYQLPPGHPAGKEIDKALFALRPDVEIIISEHTYRQRLFRAPYRARGMIRRHGAPWHMGDLAAQAWAMLAQQDPAQVDVYHAEAAGWVPHLRWTAFARKALHTQRPPKDWLRQLSDVVVAMTSTERSREVSP